VFQIGFPTTTNFSSLPRYFSRMSNRFWSYLKLEKTLTCGALRSVALSPRAALWLAAMGGAIRMRAARVFGCRLPFRQRRLLCPSRAAASPVSEPHRRLASHAALTARSDASPASPLFQPPCLSAASLPWSEAAAPPCLHAEPAAAHRFPPPP
jgi:hypothetical protein